MCSPRAPLTRSAVPQLAVGAIESGKTFSATDANQTSTPSVGLASVHSGSDHDVVVGGGGGGGGDGCDGCDGSGGGGGSGSECCTSCVLTTTSLCDSVAEVGCTAMATVCNTSPHNSHSTPHCLPRIADALMATQARQHRGVFQGCTRCCMTTRVKKSALESVQSDPPQQDRQSSRTFRIYDVRGSATRVGLRTLETET
jgi:hypothetical protein